MVNQNAPLGIQATKFGSRKYLEQAQQTVIDVLPDIRGRVFGTEDADEGIKSSTERRSAMFKGKSERGF